MNVGRPLLVYIGISHERRYTSFDSVRVMVATLEAECTQRMREHGTMKRNECIGRRDLQGADEASCTSIGL